MNTIIKSIFGLALVLGASALTSCKKCGECSTTRTFGPDTIQVANRGEYCGKDLKELDGKTETEILDSVAFTITWSCVED